MDQGAVGQATGGTEASWISLRSPPGLINGHGSLWKLEGAADPARPRSRGRSPGRRSPTSQQGHRSLCPGAELTQPRASPSLHPLLASRGAAGPPSDPWPGWEPTEGPSPTCSALGSYKEGSKGPRGPGKVPRHTQGRRPGEGQASVSDGHASSQALVCTRNLRRHHWGGWERAGDLGTTLGCLPTARPQGPCSAGGRTGPTPLAFSPGHALPWLSFPLFFASTSNKTFSWGGVFRNSSP